jgi:hypothetical protein
LQTLQKVVEMLKNRFKLQRGLFFCVPKPLKPKPPILARKPLYQSIFRENTLLKEITFKKPDLRLDIWRSGGREQGVATCPSSVKSYMLAYGIMENLIRQYDSKVGLKSRLA